MSQFNLKTEVRKSREKKIGFIPAVLYGKNIENLNLFVKEKDFIKVWKNASESTLVDVSVGDKDTRTVLIHSLQKHPLTDNVLHIDFYQVNMDEEIETDIAIIFTGVAPAVKELGGTFVKNLDKVPVRVLPKDLIKNIEIDISNLKTFDDYIYVKDLQLPGSIKVEIEDDTVVALVTPPRTQAEMDKLDEDTDVDMSQVEGMQEEDKEDKNKEKDTIENKEEMQNKE